jgi:triacylglycerol esterase/lipase EstA (alpha/beta hydrolase family)
MRPLALLFALALLLARPMTAQPAAAQPRSAPTPIVFVHGNGDHAGLWDTTIWRFESNGWPANRLFAVDLPNPSASARYTVAERNRSTPADQTAALSAFVTRVLLATGSDKVVLVGSSRGGMTIRNYVRFGGGAAHVSHAILSGAPNHGVFALPQLQPESEFNGAAQRGQRNRARRPLAHHSLRLRRQVRPARRCLARHGRRAHECGRHRPRTAWRR